MNLDAAKNNELLELCQKEGLLAPTNAQAAEQDKDLKMDIPESYNVKSFFDKYKDSNWSEDWESLEMNPEKLRVRMQHKYYLFDSFSCKVLGYKN